MGIMGKRGRLLGRMFLTALCLCCLCLAGCGETNPDGAADDVRKEFYDIQSETERLFQRRKGSEENGLLLGMQYFQGEPIQIWAFFEEEERKVYICRTDGSRELLEGMGDARNGKCYIDKDGDFYFWKRSWGLEGEGASYIQKLDKSGEEIFYTELEEDVFPLDLCQMADGSIMVLLEDRQEQEMKLQEFDSKNGLLSEKREVGLEWTISPRYIAAGSRGVLVLDAGNLEGISEIGLKDGKTLLAISFLGTSYSIENSSKEMEVQDFRMLEDGKVEILWADSSGAGVRETLCLSKLDKTVVTLRTTLLMDDGWLQMQIGEFNRMNQDYQVVLEVPDVTEQDEFGKMTAIQMVTGKGPDILYGYALEYLYDLVEKGGFENLAPYMESSGIREEDYFPYAFSCWRSGDEIYTFRMEDYPAFWCINEEILGGRDVPDINALLDAMLAWEDDIAYDYGALSENVLENLLKGSGDFWGMVDWEEGTCNFDKELFVKLLKVAKKYGLPRTKAIAGDYQISSVAGQSISCTLYDYKTEEELEKMGLVRAGTLFEDGCYPVVSGVYSAFAINAGSAQKQGAWEFLRFIMSEEVLATKGGNRVTHRGAHAKWLEKELDRLNTVEGAKGGQGTSTEILPNGQSITIVKEGYTKEDMTPERIEEYLAVREETRELTTVEYMRIRPILLIIEEEAEFFFEGGKSLEETIDIINNRVGLYIGEHH